MTVVLSALAAAPAFAADPIRPDTSRTPGVKLSVGMARICVPGYSSSVRNVGTAEKAAVYKAYGLTASPGHYEVDHLISLELGGSNDAKNLWPQSYSGTWSAHVKDRLENVLHKKVCSGSITLTTAQRAISSDWIKAYKTYIGPNPASGSADRNPG